MFSSDAWQSAGDLQGRALDSFGDDLQEVGEGGVGCALIHRRVFEKMPKPYFKTLLDDHALHVHATEDVYFCRRTRELGFRTFADGAYPCRHFKQVELLSLNTAVIERLARN